MSFANLILLCDVPGLSFAQVIAHAVKSANQTSTTKYTPDRAIVPTYVVDGGVYEKVGERFVKVSALERQTK